MLTIMTYLFIPFFPLHYSYSIIIRLFIFLFPVFLYAQENDNMHLLFDDTPRPRYIEHPSWFKKSFLQLPEDLKEALKKKKQGIILYFGQTGCAYCQRLMEINFKKKDIVAQTQAYFDVIALNVWGSREITDLDGHLLTERDYALREKTNFTPSLIFYDKNGQQALRLRGYYPPYKFRAALDYVIDGYYQKESFHQYLLRADPPPKFDLMDINEEDFFLPPPYNLDRTRFTAQKPLLIFFEQTECHACDILHGQNILHNEQVASRLKQFETVQINIWSDTPIITPSGKKRTAKEWAMELNLIYAPTLLFFDLNGNEILRIESVINLYRLQAVLEYISSGAYQTSPNYLYWSRNHNNKHE